MTQRRKSIKTPEHWLRSINRLSTSFNLASRDINTVLELLLKELVKELGAYAVAVWTIEESTNFMKIEASAGLKEEHIRYFNKTDRIRIGKGLVGRVMSDRKTLFTTNLKEEKLLDIVRWRDILTKEGFTAMISTPMFVGEKVVGAFTIYYKKRVPSISSYQVQFVEIIANQMAVTIENIKNYEIIEKDGKNLLNQVEKLVHLQKVTESLSLNFSKSVEKSLASFAHYIMERFDAEGVAIFQRQQKSDVLKLTAAFGLSNRYRNYLEQHPHHVGPNTLVGLAFRDRAIKTSSKVFVDERIDKDWRTLLSIENKTAIGVFPLLVREEVLGAIAVYYTHQHDFSEEEKSLLSMLAQYIGISLLNIETFDVLASEQQKMSFMINSLYDGLIVYDLENRITAFNYRAEELLWTAAKEVIGKTPEELDSAKNKLLENIKTISSLRLSDFESSEMTMVTPSHKVFEITLVPLKDERARKTGYMRIIHDISREREAEQLKRNFVAIAGHQLRTPLSNIKWSLNMMLDGDYGSLRKEQSARLKKTLESTDQLIKTVADVLDVSKLEEKRFEHHLIETDVCALLSQVYQQSKPTLESMGTKVDFVLEKCPPHLSKITTDPKKLHMALENIVDNALKYTPKGAVRLMVHMKDKSIRIVIKDTGIGVPKGEQKYLFTKFFRASNARRVQTQGSGLGLFISKEIIHSLHGKIGVDTQEDKGSTFVIELPYE